MFYRVMNVYLEGLLEWLERGGKCVKFFMMRLVNWFKRGVCVV